MMKKTLYAKLLSALLVLTILVASLPIIAFASHNGPNNDMVDFGGEGNGNTNVRPTAMGIESHYPMISQSLIAGHTGYLNLFSGELTYVMPLISTTDALLPFTVSLVYNSEIAGLPHNKTNTYNAYAGSYTPLGMKLNICETAILESKNGTTEYLYEDSDGTVHRFVFEDGSTYTDVDALQLTLLSENGNLVIKDTAGNTKIFSPMLNGSGFKLSRIADIYGNAVEFSFRENTDLPISVSLIPNGSTAINMLNLVYNTEGMLTMVYNPVTLDAAIIRYTTAKHLDTLDYVKCTENASVDDLTQYMNDGALTSKILPISTVYFAFNPDGKLYIAEDAISGKRLIYAYQNAIDLRIAEITDDGIGQIVAVTFKKGYTEVCTSGSDDLIDTADDIITRYVFDGEGRTCAVYSTSVDGKQIYGATIGEYQTQSDAKNQLKTSTTIGGSPVNLLFNGGFEQYMLDGGRYVFNGWRYQGDVTRESEGSHFNTNELYCASFSPDINAPAMISQDMFLSAGEYTLSFDIYSAALEYIYGTVNVYPQNSDTPIHIADIPRNITINNGNVGKFSTTFSITDEAEGELRIEIEFVKNAENDTVFSEMAYINNAVLELGAGASQYSFVAFGGFEATYYDFMVDDVWDGSFAVADIDGGFGDALVLNGSGDSEQKSYAKQTVIRSTEMMNGATISYDYILSGFVRVSTVGGISPTSIPSIRVNAYYYVESGSTETVTQSIDFTFLEGVDGWQFFASKFAAGVCEIDGVVYDRLSHIELVCEYDGAVGSAAYFDNISLVLDTGVSAKEYLCYPSTHVNSGLPMMYRSFQYYEYYEYNEDKQLSVLANSKGEMTEYFYDEDGRPTYEVTSDFYNIRNNSTYYPLYEVVVYGNPDNPPTIDDFITKTPKSLTVYTYDDYGLMTSVTVYSPVFSDSTQVTNAVEIGTTGYYKNSSTKRLSTEYTYATNGGSRIFGTLISESSENVYNTRYFYDETDARLLATVNLDSGNGTAYQYDEYDRLVTVLPATYSVTDETYSALTTAERVTYTYDSYHRLTGITTKSSEYRLTYDEFDNRTGVYIGDGQIVAYEYNSNNGKLQKVIYANGFVTEYVYNTLEMVSEVWYTKNGERWLAYSYAYNADGSLYSLTDEDRGVHTVYRYDNYGKLVGSYQYSEDDMAIDFSTELKYHNMNGLVHSSYVYLNITAADGLTYDTGSGLVHYYNADQSLNYTALYFPSATGTITYEYDAFDRVSKIYADYNNGASVGVQRDEQYIYRTYSDGKTDGLVSRYRSIINNTTTTYDYTYNNKGYIATETKGGKTYIYTYDDLGQLTTVIDGSITTYYDYDNAGNIISVRSKIGSSGGGEVIFGERAINPGTVTTLKTYTYSSSKWGDLLIAFNGNAITYDNLGNPLSYYNGSRYTFTWQGRRLVGAVKGTSTMSFTYDDNGLRTSKTVNGITTEYYRNGNLLVAEQTPYSLTVYNYDATGRPIGMSYRENSYGQYQWDVYWFDLNLQGDIVAVYNKTGVKLVSYSYDPWGKCTVSYSNGGANTSATKNNLRYRGYYLDSDLGLYYLQSRYYDPNTYRFISPDSVMSGVTGSLNGFNLYVYCFNNPINMTDAQGNWPKWNEFWSEVKRVVEIVITSYIEALEYEVGIGQGLGADLVVGAITGYRDTYVGFDNGEFVAGNRISVSGGVSVFGVSYEANHKTYAGGKNLKTSARNTDGPLDMLNYAETEKAWVISIGQFSFDSNMNLRLSFDLSAHIFFGVNCSAGFNYSEFISGLKEIWE